MLGPLEIEAATFERDLIVNGARRREAAGLVRARPEPAGPSSRPARSALNALVRECVATVQPAPRYAVPDVEALGPMPNTAEPLKTYLARLDQVARAMALAQNAYATALRDHEELVGRLEAYQAKAAATGAADRPTWPRRTTLASDALHARPCRMELARQLVTLYQTYLQLETP